MKMLFIPLLMFYYIFSFNAHAIPTMESLFRNASNTDVMPGLVELSFYLTEQGPFDLDKSSDDPSKAKLFGKISFFKEEARAPWNAVFTKRTGGKKSESHLNIENVLNFTKSMPDSERTALMSSLMLLSLNDDSGFHHLFKEDRYFRYNQELINESKQRLLLEQRSFVLRYRNNSQKLRGSTPFNPGKISDRRKARSLLRAPYFIEVPQVFLDYREGEVSIIVDLVKYEAIFDNKTHQLKKFSRKNEWSLEFVNYRSLGSKHQIPEKIILMTGSKKIILRTAEYQAKKYRKASDSSYYQQLTSQAMPLRETKSSHFLWDWN